MIKTYPNIAQSFGLFGLYLLITLLLGLAVATLSMANSSVVLLISALSMLLTLAMALKLKQAKVPYLFVRRRMATPMTYGVAALFTVFLIFVLDPITSLIPMPDSFREMFEQAFSHNIFSYLVVGVAAPLLEELLFRKLMLEGLEKNYGARKAILWSAVLFALFHLNPWQGIGAFFIGLLLGWLYLKTRDIWICIFVHFFINTLSFLAYLSFDDPFYSMLDLTGEDYYSLAGIIAISLIGMYFCFRILKREFVLTEDESLKKINE